MAITVTLKMLHTRKGRLFIDDLLRRGYMLTIVG